MNNEDGEYDASKVVDEFVDAEMRKGIWKMLGKKGHYDFIESEGVDTREETTE